MDFTLIAIPALLVFLFGAFVYGRFKFGSWTGSLLKGRIERTVGEVEFSRGVGGSHTIKVYVMKPDEPDDPFVGMVIHSSGSRGGGMQPHKLSREQARDLAIYLNQAAQSLNAPWTPN